MACYPLGAWCANTRECLAMLLRPGNAGSNTFTDHKDVLAAVIRQVPARFRAQVLVRVDGAGASHDLIKHLLGMSSPRRTVLFSCGWMITEADEAAIMAVPAGAWKPGIGQDGKAEEDKGRHRDNAPDEPRRELARRATVDRPPGQALPPPDAQPDRLREEDRLAVLHHLHEHPGLRDRRRPGQPPPQYIDVAHREHAVVETGGVRTAKTMACGTCHRRRGRSTAAGSSPRHRRRPDRLDPPAGLRRPRGPAGRRPRYAPLTGRVWHIPAHLARHARQRVLKISPDWPWKDAFLTCWHRLCALPAPA